METIRQLLARLRWDPALGTAGVVLGILDYTTDEIVRIPLASAAVDPENHDLLDVTDDTGIVRSIPLHRVRRVWRAGTLIWTRDAMQGGG